MKQVASLFQQAQSLHQRGQVARARKIYEDILKVQPQHFGALHLLGVVAAQANQPDLAVELMGRSILLNQTSAMAYSNYSNALMKVNRLHEALANYDRAIALDWSFADAYFNRGLALIELERYPAAIDSFDTVISLGANQAEAFFYRGNALSHLERYADASASFSKAIALRADYAEAHSNHGNVLRELEQYDAALTSFDRAIALKPEFAEAHSNRGNVLRDLGRVDAALASYDRAIALRPDFAEAYSNRGNLLRAQRQFDAASASYEQAIAANPSYAQAHSNRGILLKERGDLAAALSSYDRAIAIKPDYAEAYSNRGIVLHELMQLDAALESYGQAIAIRPDFAEAYENRAHTKLLLGALEDGWVDYEWRWRNESGTTFQEMKRLPQARWSGEQSLAGKTILLHSEQGLGDTLQFCRYAKAVAGLGATVILEVQRPLVKLLAGLDGVAQVIFRGEALPEIDYYCPLMSLPLAFKTSLSTIPGDAPYLKCDPEKAALWKQRLGEKAKPRVGVVWSGGFRLNEPEEWSVSRRRNIPLEKLAPLRQDGIEFHSLQVGQPAESELTQLVSNHWDGPRFIDWTPLLQDFSDTAALIEHLDLVISVDTSTAHLAGALGKPVWILNRFDSCWRWLLDRTDSPWYPTARLYRQPAPGDWGSVVTAVIADLAQLPSAARR